jgi:hypothetical protein
MKDHMGSRRWSVTALAVGLPVGVALAGVPWRAAVPVTDVVAVLVGTVAVAGRFGARATPLLAATSAGVAFDLLWVQPYGSLAVHHRGDLLTGVVLFVVGLAVAESSRRHRAARWHTRRMRRALRGRWVEASEHLGTVGRVAADIAEGDDAGLVVLDVARALVDVLDLRDCSFEPLPLAPAARPVLLHCGEVEYRGVRWDPARIGLPTAGFHVPVAARGRVVGRFDCVPRRSVPVRRDRVQVAVTLSDQAASALLLAAVP